MEMVEEEPGTVVPYRSPRQRDEVTAWIGMVVFLGSWCMMFGALFFTYGGLRTRAVAWPPAGLPLLPVTLPLLNTVCIVASSAALQYGIVALRRGHPSRLAAMLLSSLSLGAVFVGLQLVLWRSLWDQGLRPSSSAYGSVFYGLTWIHAAHVLVGLVALAWLAIRALRGDYTPARHLPVRLWAMYWHFVGAIWALMFVTVFLI